MFNRRATNEVILKILTDLGITLTTEDLKNHLIHCMINKEHHPNLKKGMYNDVVYLIFLDSKLMKIGKVGGGTRCIKVRCNDYRSKGDPLGRKILKYIEEGYNVDIWALTMKQPNISMYGIDNIQPCIGPSFEKELINRARNIGYTLDWNANNG